MKLLVINPGSTSTKVAAYEDTQELCKKTLSHSREELDAFPTLMDQLDFRYKLVLEFMDEAALKPEMLGCVVSRGGSPPNVHSGATEINNALVTALRERPMEPHPACLGPLIARRIADEAGVPAYMYDPVTANELNPLARISGVKGIENESLSHVLNTRAMGIAQAKELGRNFGEMNFIIVHFGGGNSVALWAQGRLTDTIPADSGAFSSERCGYIRCEKLVRLCKERGFETVESWFHGKGGMVSLLGTNDLREVERMVDEGHEEATFFMQVMSYQLSKSICSLLPVVSGAVDGIILTGGGAFWPKLVDEIKGRVAFLNIPVYVRPGENELRSLAEGALRVMRGEETAHIYEG